MAAWRKGTIVRITDESWTLLGETFVVTGKTRSSKGIKESELRSLDNENRTAFAKVEQATPMAEISPAENARLTERQREIKAAAEKRAREFEARMAAEAQDKVIKRAQDDEKWSQSVPELYRSWGGYAGDKDYSFEVVNRGPFYESRSEPGKLYQEEDKVTANIRPGRWGLPATCIERTINWSAMGSVSVARARAYARNILAACEFVEAEELALSIETESGAITVYPNQETK